MLDETWLSVAALEEGSENLETGKVVEEDEVVLLSVTKLVLDCGIPLLGC